MGRSDVLPDLLFFNIDKAAIILPNTKIYPIPDFVVEVLSLSTENNDRKKKYIEYALNGAKEYWIVVADNKKVEQYILFGNEYILKHEFDELHSVEFYVLQGLQIDVSSIFNEKESQRAILKIISS